MEDIKIKDHHLALLFTPNMIVMGYIPTTEYVVAVYAVIDPVMIVARGDQRGNVHMTMQDPMFPCNQMDISPVAVLHVTNMHAPARQQIEKDYASFIQARRAQSSGILLPHGHGRG